MAETLPLAPAVSGAEKTALPVMATMVPRNLTILIALILVNMGTGIKKSVPLKTNGEIVSSTHNRI